jgi:hypothetical protein
VAAAAASRGGAGVAGGTGGRLQRPASATYVQLFHIASDRISPCVEKGKERE